MLLKIILSLFIWLVITNFPAQGMLDFTERKRLHVRYINHPETIFDIHNLPMCPNYSCAEITYVSIDALQWQKILSYFNTTIDSSDTERDLLTHVIGHIETIVGEQTNTQNDIG